jgi:hypothetical protein
VVVKPLALQHWTLDGWNTTAGLGTLCIVTPY